MRLEGEKVLPHRPKITTAYAFISSLSRFRPPLTGVVVRGGEECGATAEMTSKVVSCVASCTVFVDTDCASRSSVE